MQLQIGRTFSLVLFLALIGSCAGEVSSAAVQTLGDLIYPEKGINENIDHLQDALNSLIDKFGKTIDGQTLKAMERALAAVQSTRIAYADSLSKTVNDIGNERAALLYQMQSQVIELEKFLDGKANNLLMPSSD